MHIRLLAAIGGLCLLSPAGALAQDAGYDWTGFYAGVIGGHFAAGVDVGNFQIEGNPVSELPEFRLDFDGLAGGVTIGANFQHGNMVFGVEGDYIYSVAKGEHYDTDANFIVNMERQQIVTLRGRAGYAFDNLLLYGTAGVAFADVDVRFTDIYTAGNLEYERTRRHFGWVAGAGAEVGLTDHISVKGEALYHSLGTQTYDFPLPNSVVVDADGKVGGWMARVGVNARY